MTSIDKAIIGKIIKNGERFELFLDPDKTYDYIRGVKKDTSGILVVDEVFKDARKGERQSPNVIKKAFGDVSIQEILLEVLKYGEIQFTTAQRRKLIEEKRKQIIDYLAKNCIDAQTKLPIPPLRIENAMNNIKYNIDPFKPVDVQAKEILNELIKYLPIKIAMYVVELRIPAESVYKVHNMIKRMNPKKMEKDSEGNLKVVLEIPSGMQSEVYESLNRVLAGQLQSKILEVKE